MRNTVAIAVVAVVLFGYAPIQAKTDKDAELAAATPIGEPKDCVRLTDIDHTRVRNNATIDFVMKNRTVFRNTLPHECPSLGFNEKFSYSTSINQLCSVDTITVLESSNMRGASCGLGKFQQVEPPPRGAK